LKSNTILPTAKDTISHKERVYIIDNSEKLLAKKMNAKAVKGMKFSSIPNNDGRKYKPEKIYEWEAKEKDKKKKKK
jgi:hypothetical protein